MGLSPRDLQIVQDMKQREFAQKKRKRAANAMYHEGRRYRSTIRFVIMVCVMLLVGIGWGLWNHLFGHGWAGVWRGIWPSLLIGLVIGWLVASTWLSSSAGKRVLENKAAALREKYSGDLHAGRRWQQFFYHGEEISALIPRILYSLDGKHGRAGKHEFDSLEDVIADVKGGRVQHERFRARGQEIFNSIVAATDLVLLSTVDDDGRPSSRFMRFVRSDRDGVWYVTSAPATPKIHEFDRGVAAIVTIPDESGATISSNRVRLRRSGRTFPDIAELYRQQVPRYLDGMTDEDQAAEVVYELVIESARVSSWEFNEAITFDANRPAARLTAEPLSE